MVQPGDMIVLAGSGSVGTAFHGAVFNLGPSGLQRQVLLAGAPLREPSGVAVTPSDDVIVSDYMAHAIFLIEHLGALTTVKSGLPLVQPIAIALDTSGNIVVFDLGHRLPANSTPPPIPPSIYIVPINCNNACNLGTRAGTDIVVVKQGTPLPSAMTAILYDAGLAVDASGNVIFAYGCALCSPSIPPVVLSIPLSCANACRANERPGTFVPGEINTIASSVQGLKQPTGLAVDRSGDIIVADGLAHAIFRVPRSCANTCAMATIASGSPLRRPAGMAVDASGDIIVSDPDSRAIYRVSPSSGAVTTIAEGYPIVIGAPQPPCFEPCLDAPYALAIAPSPTPIPEYPLGPTTVFVTALVVSLFLIRRIHRCWPHARSSRSSRLASSEDQPPTARAFHSLKSRIRWSES